MNSNEIRMKNIQHIIDQRCDGNRSKFALKLGREAVSIGRWWTKSKHKRNVGDDSAREIEIAFGLPKDWIDNLHDSYHDLEIDPRTRSDLKLMHGDASYPTLRQSAAVDQNLRLTLLDDREGSLMILSTDENAYALQLIGHNPTFFLGSGWVILVEPSTPLAQDECALLLLDSGELLLRLIVHIGEDMLIVRNPATGVQDNIPRSRVVRAEYAYIGFPPTKVKINKPI